MNHQSTRRTTGMTFPKSSSRNSQLLGSAESATFLLTCMRGRKLFQSTVYFSSKLNHCSSCCEHSILRKGIRELQRSALDSYQCSTLAKPLTLPWPHFLPPATELIPKTVSTVIFLLSFKKREVTEYIHCYQVLYLTCEY